jgi:hypothetical protein
MSGRGQEAIIEFRQVGEMMKVSAIDPETGIEVSVPMPINAARADMIRLAVRKLEYVLKKGDNI